MDVDYRNALGLVVWTFIELEWNAVNVGNRIEPGFISKTDKMMAGVIADNIIRIVGVLNASPDQERLAKEVVNFKLLVSVRNDLLHAGPAADVNQGGASSLYRKHVLLSMEFIKKAADDFFDCSTALNADLHGFLNNKGSAES